MRILISGQTGQDGSILAERLEEEGHEVFGLVRDQSVLSLPHGHIIRGDLTDPASVYRAVVESNPDEVYNLGAYTHAGFSFQEAHYVGLVNGLGAATVFEAVRQFAPNARVYQASTSEMFGNGPMPANEETPLAPVSPYGVAKAYAHQMAHVYRNMGVWIACGILFNHVSPRHGTEFLPTKLAKAARDIRAGKAHEVKLGNLYPIRDWGWAPEFVGGIIKVMRHTEPDDFVVATGVPCSVAELGKAVFGAFGLDFMPYTVRDESEVRPTEIGQLCGDATKARLVLGWEAQKTWLWIAQKLADSVRDRVMV